MLGTTNNKKDSLGTTNGKKKKRSNQNQAHNHNPYYNRARIVYIKSGIKSSL